MCDSSPTLPNETKHERAKGLAIALFGVLSISPDALLVRFLSTHGADPWVIVFWKLLFSIPLTACWALVEAGGVKKLMNTITSGSRFYCMVVPVQSMIDIGFTLSFVYTSAAVALLLINLNPLWGAILGTFVLNDVMPIRTYIALALALVCIMIMFVPEMVIEVESNATSSLRGNVISLFTGFLCAVYLSTVRKAGQQDISLVGGTPFSAAISVILSAIKTRGRIFPGLFWDTDIWKFWLALLAQGFSIGIILVTEATAPRYISASEIGLCGLFEVILGPLFVFLAYNEAPSKWTLIGGSLLFCVLAAHESRPLFDKSRQLYQTLSDRFSSSSRIGDSMESHRLAEALLNNTDKESMEHEGV